MIQTSQSDGACIIHVIGQFDLPLREPFLEAFRAARPTQEIVIDLERCTGVTSFAIGILIAMLEEAGGPGREIRVVKCSPEARRVFEIANLHQLLNIS
ncbi:MAG: STAS domain-containing protein [Planctomycetota bacterium]